MTVQNKWREGETKESIAACLKKVQATTMTVEGIISFQYAINAETKTNQVTEIYTDAGVIAKFFEALGDPAVAFAAVEASTSVICCGPKDQVDAASAALGGLGLTPTLFYMDTVG